MIQKIKNILTGLAFVVFVASPVLVATNPVAEPVGAAACSARFLGLPAWYRGLTEEDDCSKLLSPTSVEGGLSGYIGTLILNLIEAALFLVGYISIIFLIYGGFQFLTGGATADRTAKARKTITNALIGLVISILAIAIVNFVFNFVLTGTAG